MRLLNFLFKKEDKAKHSNKFSRFFLETSSKEKEKIIMEAARRANEDQRKLFYDKINPTTKPVH